MRVPSLLLPFPFAADNHQFHNARAFEETGAARLLEQRDSTPDRVVTALWELVEDSVAREGIQTALKPWHTPNAAEQIAEFVFAPVVSPVEPVCPQPEGRTNAAPRPNAALGRRHGCLMTHA